ncbi:MAG: hypothetical protein GXO20_07480 [Thermodesulfobacteria bacterium]|nr:hypothetical protein [Thermodesulfobacteriota bacterium]
MALGIPFSRLLQHPTTLLILSFGGANILGTLLLLLPWMHRGNLSFVDALFTSTSAVCVTGLTVLNTAKDFTRLGQMVILLLIQIGGLGVMTFSILIVYGLGKALKFRSIHFLQESFLPYKSGDIRTLLFSIFGYTLASEFFLFFLLFLGFLPRFSFSEALYQALFHSVSAFCNAGFSTLEKGLVEYQKGYFVPLVVALGVLLGNTGFPIVYEFVDRLRGLRNRFSLHFKITLLTHVFLLLLGSVVLLLFEWSSAFGELSIFGKVLTAFFHSVNARTAGFNTVDLSLFSEHSIYLLVLLMFIGACPGSTGGGIKTTTMAVIWVTAISRFRGYTKTVVLKRTIPELQVSKAMTLFVFAVTVVVLFHLVLSLALPILPFYAAHGEFLATLFETVSALGTVGLSTGLTPHFSVFGKIVLILAMFFGRVGLLSLLSILAEIKPPRPYHYAPEEVMIG